MVLSEIVHEVFFSPTAGWWRREGVEINHLGFSRLMCFRGDLNVYHRVLDRRKTREKAFVYPHRTHYSWFRGFTRGYSWFSCLAFVYKGFSEILVCVTIISNGILM